MRLQDPSVRTVVPEAEIYRASLPLDDADILELGCGRAEHTRAIAERYPRARILALEVDRAQHEINVASSAPPNLRFEYGGAEAIPAANASFDVVMLFKSLHHVPGEHLDTALREVARVLRPGGLAYISEPVFAGEFNEIIRIFHDEERVRRNAFEAIRRAVACGLFELVEERFFLAPVQFRDFAEFERRQIGVTHTQHRLTPEQYARVRERFTRSAGPDGSARFEMPMRVDLLRVG
jgi:SAM-dependent methyltransferase